MASDNLLRIMGILKAYSSEENKLKASDIFDRLGGDIDIKTVRTTLKNLFRDLGPNSDSEIKNNNYFNCVVHCYREGKRGTIYQGRFEEIKDVESLPNKVELFYWMENKLSDSMIDLLKASVVSNQYLSARKTAELVKALDDAKNARDNLSTEESYKTILVTDEDQRAKGKKSTDSTVVANDKTMENLNALMEIIRARKKVRFEYCTYNANIELQPRTYLGFALYNPYAILSINGYYYVLATSAEGKYAKVPPEKRMLISYRIDRIGRIEKDSSAREKRPAELEPYFTKGAFNAIKYRTEHPAMMGGVAYTADLLCGEKRFNNLIDTFGFSIKVIHEQERLDDKGKLIEKYYTVRVTASEEGLKLICKSYCSDCTMLSCSQKPELPQIICDEMKEAAKFSEFLINSKKQKNKK